MLDYKLLHALSTVIQQQSFDKAADILCISQSAVSQRIKLLEQTIGQPVLIRSQPLDLTGMGKKLLAHYQQVSLLEQDILPELKGNPRDKIVPINIAVNADSLATWLIPALTLVDKQFSLELNFLVADETHGINFLKNGEAFGAISTQNKALPGCTLTKLGDMPYLLVSAPKFKQHYFAAGVTKQSLQRAPAVAFDQKDNMHVNYLEQKFALSSGSYPCHTVRSSEAFVEFAKQGLAYCLIPKLQIEQELASGKLINLLPKQALTRPLYWHHWVLLKGAFKAVSDTIIAQGQKALTQK